MAASTYFNAVQKLYIAFYQRAGDPGGLLYWAGKASDNNGDLSTIISAFATSAEATALYGTINSSTIGNVIDAVYQALFNRAPDAGGKQFYIDGFNKGTFTAGSIALNILAGASNLDDIAISNKLKAANNFSSIVDGHDMATNPDFGRSSSVATYDSADTIAARNFLKAVTSDPATVPALNGVSSYIRTNIANAGDPILATNTFTLTEVIVPGKLEVAPQYVTMWGYNPHKHSETGVDNGNTGNNNGNQNQTNEGPEDGGIPVADLVSFLTTTTGLDLRELGLIDANGVDPFQNVTSLSLSNPLSSGANTSGQGGTGNNTQSSGNTLTISYADGTSLNAEVKLGQSYFKFLNDLLFDAQGNTRLYQKAVPGTGSSAVAASLTPIKLTTTTNNGGTMELGYTTSNDDIIVAGRLDLLHGAYIDGGAGYNILEIDAKGTYAQPAELLNIQEVRVNDLPNFYTTDGTDQNGALLNNGYLGNSSFPYLSTTAAINDDSWLDLSRATAIKKLVVTDQGQGKLTTDYSYSGNLSIVGVRNAALLRLEGAFTSGATTIQYGQGQTGTLSVELALGDVTQDINILQNAAVLNINSTGVVNHMHQFFAGGSISRMMVTGTGAFAVDQNIAPSFNQNAAVLIDATANTGGLNINFDATDSDRNAGTNASGRFASVTVKGTAADDEIFVKNVKALTGDVVASNNGATTFTSSTNGKVTIDTGNGDNVVVTTGSSLVKITTGTGSDTILADSGQVVSIVAGDGDNVINANSSKIVTINTGAGTDNISAQSGETVVIVAGDGNNMINTDSSQVVSITTGTGNDTISSIGSVAVVVDAGVGNNKIEATAAVSVTITTGAGNDTIAAVGPAITITSGGGTDSIRLSGTYASDGLDNTNIGNASDGSLLNINTGATGSATIWFGNDQTGATPAWSQNLKGVTAMDGSVIAGNNVKLYIDSPTNLVWANLAGLTGTTKVVVEQGDTLRISSDQFTQLGAAAFSENLAGAGAQVGDVYIVVMAGKTFDLSAMDISALSPNVKLHFELQEAANLTLTASQLHNYLANDAINSVSDTNGAAANSPNGIVTLKAVGSNFNIANDGDADRVFGTITEAKVDNLIITRDATGFNRPTDVVTSDVYTVDSTGAAALVLSAPIVSVATKLVVMGNQDVNFTAAPVTLGAARTDPVGTTATNDYWMDWSTLTGKVIGLTINEFDDVNALGIKGNDNATNGFNTRVNVVLQGNVGEAGNLKGLTSSGVSQYIVTGVNDTANNDGDASADTATFFLCDNTKDVKVIGLHGNAGKTVTFAQVPWGKVAPTILLEGDGYANWNEGMKVDGNPNESNIGKVIVSFDSLQGTAAPAVVNINNGGVPLGVTSTGGERGFRVDGIKLENAASLTINVTEGDAVIDALEQTGTNLKTLVINGTDVSTADPSGKADITVTATLPSSLTTVNASGVTGVFTAKITDPGTNKLAFTGSAGGVKLTLDGVNITSTAGVDDNGSSIDGGAGKADLTIMNSSDLAAAVLSNIKSVTLNNGTAITLSLPQAAAIGNANIKVAKTGDAGTLNLVGLDNTPFSVGTLTTGVSIGTVTLASNPTVTLDATTNLTGVQTLAVPDGTTLTMSVTQFQQLGVGGVRSITGTGGVNKGTVNLTGLKQSDINPLDLNGDGLYTGAGEHAGLDLSVISNVKFGSITLAESVALKSTDSLGSFKNITLSGDGMSLTLGEINQAHGLKISGGTNTSVKITDTDLAGTAGNAAPYAGKIDASGLNVTTIKLLNTLVAGKNVDEFLDHLPGSVVKEIYNDLGWVTLINQIVTINAGTTVPGLLVFNPTTNDTELQNFTLNMSGGTEISGNLNLASTTKIVNSAQQLRTHLDTLTINSTGTTANLLNGKTANTIAGDITPMANPAVADNNTPTVVGASQNNNLLNLVINASQSLVVTGDTVFSSVVGDDGFTGNDNSAAIAKITVTGAANVTLNTVNTLDTDVDGLTVTNNGTGTLSLTIDAAKIDQVVGTNNDALSFLGTGTIALTTVGAVDLSDDTLTAVKSIKVSDTASPLTVSFAQYNAITAAGFSVIDGTDGGTTVDVANATLNIVGYDGTAFTAPSINTKFGTVNLKLADADVTLASTVDLTNIAQIEVADGRTLTMTGAQFQQLKGKGKIIGYDGVDANTSVDAFNVVISDLKQADVTRNNDTAGHADNDTDTIDATDTLDLTDITAGTKITIKLGESSVQMGTLNPANNTPYSSAKLNGASFELADNQTLVLVTSTQADGLKVSGGTNTTLVLRFAAMDAADTTTGINAAGYKVTSLKALDTFVDGTNVEFRMLNVPSTVTEYYYHDPLAVGFVNPTTRVVVVEKTVTVPGYLMYNDPQTTQEVRSLDLTMAGGSEITGDLNLSTIAKSGSLTTQYFDALTIHSAGTATDKNLLTAAASNLITGSIHARGVDVSTGNTGNVTETENNLLKVTLDATTQALKVGGDIVFSKVGATADGAATLTLTGASNVQVEQLDVSDAQVVSLTIANNGTGTLTVTGASPAIFDGNSSGGYAVPAGAETGDNAANLKTLTFTGTGNVVLGTHPDTTVTTEWGITASNLSVITAAGMTGSLDLGEIKDVSTAGFAFTSGTGTTKLTLTSDVLDAAANKSATWSFDMSNAGANSELHIGTMGANAFGNNADLVSTTESNALDIKLGANTTLYIDADTDFTQLDGFALTQTKNIVLKDGKTLTLTAAQANGLKIVAGADDTTNGTGISTATKVNIIDLSTAAVDFSGIATNISGTVKLKQSNTTTHAADVTLDAATNLGDFTVVLETLDLGDGTLAGQTVRYNTVAQADNAVSVIASELGAVTTANLAADTGVNSSNVVWLFNSITGPVDTSKYSAKLGRLLFNSTLATSVGNVENMFTTLPSSILRLDFATVAALNILLTSAKVDRVMEFSNFTSVGNLSYSDIGLTPVEHLHSLKMQLGGQATVGNVLIDDVIPATGYNPIGSDQFTTLTVESYRALTGRTDVSVDPDGTGPLPTVNNPNPNYLASEAYVNNNNGIDTTSETALPNNINTVGNIGVGSTNGLDLLNVKLDTKTLSVIGDGSAGNGANLKTGTITFGTVVPASTANLVVTGANNIDATSVVATDTDITALTVTATGFTGTLTAPGASPALNLGTTVATLTFTNANAANAVNMTVNADGTDNDNERLTVNYIADGVAGTTVVDMSAGVNVTDASAVATAIKNHLNTIAAITAAVNGGAVGSAGAVVTATPAAGHTFDITSVAVSAGTATSLGGTITHNGGVITLGGATKAGIAGSALTKLNAVDFDGILNLGTISSLDSTNNDDLNVAGVDTLLKAFTFTASNAGITTATLGAMEGTTPTLNTGSEWEFIYTNAAAGSYLKITPSVVFQVDSILRLTDVPLRIEGAVNLTAMVNNPATAATDGLIMTGGSIEVLSGATLTLTVAQARSLMNGNVQIYGAGTLKLTGDDSNPTVPGADTPLGVSQTALNYFRTAIIDLSAVTLIASPTAGFDTDAMLKLNVGDANTGLAAVPVAANQTITGSAANDQITIDRTTAPASTMSHTINVAAGTDTIIGLRSDLASVLVNPVKDVLVVSGTGTATATLATGVNFVATSGTSNSGTLATINGFADDNTTIDVSLATGTKGFTITGGTDGAAGMDTLIGSAQADTINGGSLTQTNALAIDTLTGNGGNDTFVFNLNSQTATLTVATTTAAIDREVLTMTADGTDNNDETLTVYYSVNGAATTAVIDLSSASLAVTDLTALTSAVASALDAKAGIAATVGSGAGEVIVTGDSGASVVITGVLNGGTTNGMAAAYASLGFALDNNDDNDETLTINYTVAGAAAANRVVNLTDPMNMVTVAAEVAASLSGVAGLSGVVSNVGNRVIFTSTTGALVTVNSITPGGTFTTLAGSFVNATNTDTAQVTTLTVTGTPTVGDTYSALATFVTGGGGSGTHTAVMGNDAAAIAAGLSGTFSVAGISDAVVGGVVTFTDSGADNGGFTLAKDTTAAFGGSGASENLSTNNPATLALAFADRITDFTQANDKVSFVNQAGVSMGAGTASNFVLAGAAAATYAAAEIAADAALGAGVIYYLTTETADNIGLLFFDASGDGNADGVVQLSGVTTSNFTFANII